jgi:predicted DNA-binding ribbon-helix-helix protein
MASDPRRLRKRSITIQGHRTSIALEGIFWTALENAARAETKSLAHLVSEIDEARTTALASAIRVWLYERAGG